MNPRKHSPSENKEDTDAIASNVPQTNLVLESLHHVSDIEMAEIAKNIEYAHKYLQIAFAEDLYLYCKANNLSFTELMGAINTKWNVNVPEPKDRTEVHSVSEDERIFLQSPGMTRSKIMLAAMEVNKDYIKLKKSEVGVSPKSEYEQCTT
jgi:UDP-N-acetyl-D-mannosaminuronic acid dehydrogenase